MAKKRKRQQKVVLAEAQPTINEQEGEEEMITYVNGDEYILGLPSEFIGKIMVLAGALTLLCVVVIHIFKLSYEPVELELYAIPGIVCLGGAIFWYLASRQRKR